MISEEAKAALKGRAKWLPKDPPLANNPEGDTSVREMCEDQTEKELNCVWEIYQGLGSYMRKGIENGYHSPDMGVCGEGHFAGDLKSPG